MKVWEPRLQNDFEIKMLKDSISSTATYPLYSSKKNFHIIGNLNVSWN